MNAIIDNSFRRQLYVSTRRSVAISPGRIWGFAAGDYGAMISGGWRLAVRRAFETPEQKFTRVLNDLHAAYPLDLILIRAPFGGIADRHKRGKAAIEAWANEAGVRLATVGDGEIKKSFTGHGRASAEQMVREAERRGIMVATAAEAEAVALLDWLLGGSSSAPAEYA